MNDQSMGRALKVAPLACILAFLVTPGCDVNTSSRGSSGERTTTSAAAISAPSAPPPGYIADCNDPDSPDFTCVEPNAEIRKELQTEGYPYYVGHAEPSALFFSSAANSGSNMQWKFSLAATDPAPTQNGSSVANFELYATQWLGLALCDPNSNPFGACTPVSDANNPATAGAAFLELQFYPPGSPFGGCSNTQWCARLHINTFQNGTKFEKATCLEPSPSQYLTTNGTVAGSKLLMSNGDSLLVTIHDTPNGLQTDVNDLTTGATGTMTASGANGFVHNTAVSASGVCSVTQTTSCTTNANCPSGEKCVCATAPFNFHPMYATAAPGQVVPWATLKPNVSFDSEIGHWELCGDSACKTLPYGADDGSCSVTSSQICKTNANCPAGETCNVQTSANCGPIRGVGGCTDPDLDQDGVCYNANWPDGTAAHPASVVIGSPNDTGVGPLSASPTSSTSYIQGYNTINFSTTESTATAFYPFFSQAGNGAACRFNFGNDIPGTTTNDFSKAAQYGFIKRPWPGSNGFPTPEATRDAARSFGSFTTSVPCLNRAKSFPFALSPFEPNLLAPGWVFSKASMTGASFGSDRSARRGLTARGSSAEDRACSAAPFDLADAFPSDPVFRLRAGFGGKDDAKLTPRPTHFAQAGRVRRPSGATSTIPASARPVRSIGRA